MTKLESSFSRRRELIIVEAEIATASNGSFSVASMLPPVAVTDPQHSAGGAGHRVLGMNFPSDLESWAILAGLQSHRVAPEGAPWP
jgi:hypothetical protein